MKFLIAEDTFEVLEYIRKYLIESGHFVFCANDGEEALKIFQKEEIDGIFCVLTLPKLGGLELLNEVKSSSKTCPFVMICPHEDSENALDALQLGACDFLIKTIKNHDLQRTLDRVTNLTDGFNSGESDLAGLAYENQHLSFQSRSIIVTWLVA